MPVDLPTLLAAFLYFDLSFMAWVVLGPLAVQIAQDLGLTPAQKGLMVATPVLAGALFRVVMGVLVVPVGRARSFLIAIVPYAGVWFIFTALRSLADETIFARTLNLHVAEFERELFSGRIPTVRLQDKYFEPGSAGWLDYFLTAVHWSYFVVPHVAAVLIWYKRPDIFRRFLSGMALMLAIGVVGVYVFRTFQEVLARPRYLFDETVNVGEE